MHADRPRLACIDPRALIGVWSWIFEVEGNGKREKGEHRRAEEYPFYVGRYVSRIEEASRGVVEIIDEEFTRVDCL